MKSPTEINLTKFYRKTNKTDFGESILKEIWVTGRDAKSRQGDETKKRKSVFWTTFSMERTTEGERPSE
jgi:hypothetical protein